MTQKTYRRRLLTNLRVRGKKDTRHPDVIAMERLRDLWNGTVNAQLDAEHADPDTAEMYNGFLEGAKAEFSKVLIETMEQQDGLDPERFSKPLAGQQS